jgi:hypothetical protein
VILSFGGGILLFEIKKKNGEIITGDYMELPKVLDGIIKKETYVSYAKLVPESETDKEFLDLMEKYCASKYTPDNAKC